MMDYTETYTDPNIKLDNGDPVLLWIRYQGSNKGNCTITIKGEVSDETYYEEY